MLARGATAAARPSASAARIVADVRRRGDAALFSWTKRFDRLALHRRNVWVSRAELTQRIAQRLGRISGGRRSRRAQYSRRRAPPEAAGVDDRSRAGRARRPARARDRIGRLLSSRRPIFAGFHLADDGDSRAGSRRAQNCRCEPAARRRAARRGRKAGRACRRARGRRAGHRRARLRHALDSARR